MKKLGKNLFAILISLMIISGITSIGAVSFAQDEEIPKDGVSYILTYPDGTKVSENANGDPLSYSDVQELLKSANWKKMAEGLVSDANGKVELDAAWNKGSIRIVETKVPAGYTQGTESEKTAELEDGSAEFVNPKEKDPDPKPPVEPEVYEITYDLNGGEYAGSTESIVEFHKDGEIISIHEAPEREGYEFDYWKGSEYQPGDSYTVTADHTFTAQWIKEDEPTPTPEDMDTPTDTPTGTTIPSGSPKTGDGNTVVIYVIIGGVAAAIFAFLAFKKRRVRAGIISMMLISVFAIGAVYAAEGFVINKIDDNGDPVEGAVFDIYGKPEVTWEEITTPEGKVEIRIEKVWEDGGNQDGIRPDEVKVNITADGEKLTQAVVKNTDEWYYTLGDLPRYDSTGAEIAYRWEEEPVNGYATASYKADTHYDGNDKFIDLTITNSHTPATVTVSGTKTWTSSTGNNDDLDTSKIPEKYTVRLEKSTDGTNWTTVSSQEVSSYMAPPPMSPTDPILPVDEWTFDNQPKYENGVELQYRVVEETVPAGFTMTGGTKDANGEYNITNTYTPTTSSVNIKVGLTHRIFPGAHWSDIVANPQKVTVSGGSMTDKVLSFTPETAAQEVELPGAGTYTISMTGITQSDLQQEDALSDKVSEYMPLLIDTVSATVTVDASGNCTVNGSPTYETFAFGMDQGGTFIYNDIDALKEAYNGADDGLDKRKPHSVDAGAVADGNTITLTAVISQVWDSSTEIEEI